jgi:hypothetical protein
MSKNAEYVQLLEAALNKYIQDNDYDVDWLDFGRSTHVIPDFGITHPIECHELTRETHYDSEDVWSIFSVNGRFFRKKGFFISYGGFEWDTSLEEVQSVEKIINVWEKVEN